MRPTDEILNETMAQACGWRRSPAWWVRPDDFVTCLPCPAYCTDRNTHSEIAELILKKGLASQFCSWLWNDEDIWNTPDQPLFDAVFAQPRLVVEVALKAMGLWKEEWSGEEMP